MTSEAALDKAQEAGLTSTRSRPASCALTSEAALDKAQEAGLDLVEVSPNAKPPVCRIMDFGKYRFESSKKQQASKKKQKRTQIKEIKFRPRTEEGDYQVKLRKLRNFLEKGDKTKVTMRYRGREFAHQELGMELLKRVEADLEDVRLHDLRHSFASYLVNAGVSITAPRAVLNRMAEERILPRKRSSTRWCLSTTT